MKYILHTLGLAIFFFSLSEICAQDTKWREVFFQDFGGNNVNDPKFGDALSSDEVGSSMTYTKYWQSFGYGLVKTSSDNPSWHTGSDHTIIDDNTRGYYMRINPDGSSSDVVLYKQKLTGICPGVKFRFSAWMANLLLNTPALSGAKPPYLKIGIYEDPEALTLVSSDAKKDLKVPYCEDNNSASLDWQPLELEFKTSNNSNTAYFIVTVIQPERNGFDFAIDDIKIEVEQPAINITNTEYIYGEPVTLSATFTNNNFFPDLSIVKYKWQYSADGTSFSDISGSENYYNADNKCSYTIPSFDKTINNGYYRVIIGEEGNLGKPICSIQEDFRINETKNKMHVYLCQGETREIQGTTLNANTLTDGVSISAGSEFTFIIHISKPKIEDKPDTLLCVGSIVDGITYNTIGSFTISDTIPSTSGCDSLIINQKHVVTGPTESTKASKSICEGDTYEGTLYDTAGNFSDTTESGCIKYIQPIVVNPTYNQNIIQSVCQGSTFNGDTYNNAGSFFKTYTLQSAHGCDSIVNVTINVTEKIYAQLDTMELCEGSDTYTFDGTVYSAAGEYDLSSTSTSLASGCDSVTTMHLTIHPRFSNKSNPIDTMICYDSQLFGTIYPEPTSDPILVRDPQVYKTQYGCDSMVYYNVTVLQIQLKLKIKSDRNTVCQGEEVEIYIKDLKPSNTPLSWEPELGGSNNKRKTFTPTEDLICVVKARNDVAQCETTDTVKVYVRESPVMTIDTLNERENIVKYSVTGGTPNYSIFLDTKQVETAASGELTNMAIGSHKLWVSDKNECTSYTQFAINPIPITPSGLFTPNGDGINDIWKIENIDIYPKSRVRIYDRDGKLLAEYNTYDNDNGWDGTYLGKKLPSSDYWYEINLVEADKQYVGHFTLIR